MTPADTGAGGGTGNGNGGDNVVHFPETEAERRAMRKLQQDRERQRLVNVFVDEDRALFHDPNGVAYADLIIGGHRETWPIKSKEFRSAYIGYLQRQFDRLVAEGSTLAMGLKTAMSKSAVNAAISDFEIRAISSTSPVRDVHVRVAGHGNDIFIDLCNAGWEAVRITAAGWSVVADPPVRFRRTRGMRPLPYPERNGTIAALRPFVNVSTDADFSITVAWLLAAMRPRGPYAALNLYGEHGSAKSWLIGQVLRAFIDPHTVPTTRLPSSSRDLFIAAYNSHVLMFANVSSISDAMSDDLCRLATGEGARTRSLFTDTEEALFGGERPIAIEGINRTVLRMDLLSRSVVLVIPPLSGYETTRALRARFERQQASIFGTLLTMMARGVDKLPTTKLVNPPRMADFTEWGVACGIADFEEVYAANRREAISVMLEDDPFARAVRGLMARRNQWRGTAQALLDAVGPAAGASSTQAISDWLRRLAPALRTVGLHVVYEQRKKDQRPLRIERVTPVTTPL
jgi:hypothetical protein